MIARCTCCWHCTMPHILGGLDDINISLHLPIINLCIASENKNNLFVLTELLFEQS